MFQYFSAAFSFNRSFLQSVPFMKPAAERSFVIDFCAACKRQSYIYQPKLMDFFLQDLKLCGKTFSDAFYHQHYLS
jgi:hypothetical protein